MTAPESSGRLFPGGTSASPATLAEKVGLFGALFRGRTDVYAHRWENPRSGRSGYSPTCANEWTRPLCGKPRVRCGECPGRALAPLTEGVLLAHLQGKLVAGLYPLVDGDRCHLVAVDLDGAGWQDDVRACAAAARDLGLPVAIERSRSGNGAHAWFFFETAVSAGAARRLAGIVLAEAGSRRPDLAFGSYDRLFPSQDAVPRGGLGNLIALPLQGRARARGNTVFLDESLEPIADQWEFLARLRRIPPETLERVAAEALRRGLAAGVPLAREREAEYRAA